MRIATIALFPLAAFTSSSASKPQGQDASATLAASSKAMGIAGLTSIEYKGIGSSYNFGQAINVASPWRHLILKNYVADIDYGAPAMREEMYRNMPDGTPPFGGFLQVQFVSGSDAWNLLGDPPAASPAPATAMERKLQIWLTPGGFLKAATASHSTAKRQGTNTIVTFMT